MSFRWRQTTLIIIGFLFFLIGLWASKYGIKVSWSLLIASLLVLPIALGKKWYAVVVVVVAGLSLGIYRGSLVASQLAAYELNKDKEVKILGQVLDDPAYTDNGQKEFNLGKLKLIEHNNSQTPLPGTVVVSGFGINDIRRGDAAEVRGKLRGGFGSKQGYIRYADIAIVSRTDSAIETLRKQFFAGTFTALPEPQASLGLGFLAGVRTLLPDVLTEQLSITGLTHIVAVSGYNLTILVRLTRRIFIKHSKFIATASSAFLILGFLAVTGLSPSISRAAIVSALALSAWYYGRNISPIMLLLASGVVTAGINPLFIWFDLGWWLSFLAFFGVLVLAPLIRKRIFQDKEISQFLYIVIETTSAQLLVLPLIVAVFGELSIISILANVLILPLIPFAMILTFAAGLAGAFIPVIAGWIAWPATTLLTAMTTVIYWLSQVPWALVELSMDLFQSAVFYSSIMLLTLILYKRLKPSVDGSLLNGAEVID